MENIIYFNKDLKDVDEKTRNKLGIRGKRAVELATMGLPIAPGFILDSELTKKLPDVNLKEILKTYITQLEKETKKEFGGTENPLLLKVVLSSDLNAPYFPSIHNIGMNLTSVQGFAKHTGTDFAYGEYLFFLKNLGLKLYDISEEEIIKIGGKLPANPKTEQLKKSIDQFLKYYENKYSDDVNDQLSIILKGVSRKYCESDIDVDNSLSIMVQVMVYGNYGQNSYSGNYFTRNIVNGDPEIQGYFLKNEFDDIYGKKNDIQRIEKKYYDQFKKIAENVEEKFKELRSIKFTIEEGNLWLVEQRDVDEKSTQSQIKTLLDLNKKKLYQMSILYRPSNLTS